MSFSPYSFASFFVIFVGYILKSFTLQYFFYFCTDSYLIRNYYGVMRKKNAENNITPSEEFSKKRGRLWGWPLISKKSNRGPYHRFITAWNLLIASLFAFFVTEFGYRGFTCIRFDSIQEYGIYSAFLDFLKAFLHQSVIEYYWHRIMHLKFFYSTFHKIHHFYKSPEPWDDMYIHPLEAFGYYCILYSPPFVYSMHLYSFIFYMILMGLCGVLDHSGVILVIPGVYSTVDHYFHHEKFNVNYSFPFPFMDIIHGTHYSYDISIERT